MFSSRCLFALIKGLITSDRSIALDPLNYVDVLMFPFLSGLHRLLIIIVNRKKQSYRTQSFLFV